MSLNLAVLASGGGSNLQAILDAISGGRLDSRVILVASNKPEAGALERARQAGVPAEHVAPGPDYDERLYALIEAAAPDLVILAGYLKMIDSRLVSRWRGAMLNIHPALLPSFGGKGMYGIHVHEAVIESGVRVTGVTVHLVDEVFDRGPIVAQVPVPVLPQDTPQDLQARVLESEHALYPVVIGWFADGRVGIDGRRVTVMGAAPSQIR